MSKALVQRGLHVRNVIMTGLTEPGPALPPLFLSLSALDRAMHIHASVSARSVSMRDSVDEARQRLAETSWADFDDVYLSLYTLSLLGVGREVRLPHPDLQGGSEFRREGVQFILDFELRNERNEFKLLDERAVVAVMNFRQAFTRLVPFRVAPAAIGFGCVFLGFDVYMICPRRVVRAGC